MRLTGGRSTRSQPTDRSDQKHHRLAIRVGRGDPGVQLNTLMTAGAAVGLEIGLQAYPGRGPRLRDSGHLELAKMLIGLAHARWRTAIEVPAGDHGRSADLVFYGTDEVVHLEIERFAVDFQAQYRAALRKREYLASGEARAARLVLCLEDRPPIYRASHAGWRRTRRWCGAAPVVGRVRTRGDLRTTAGGSERY